MLSGDALKVEERTAVVGITCDRDGVAIHRGAIASLEVHATK